MDYVKEYKKLINSHYLSEGVRITAGIALPAIVLSYFNLLSAGIVVSLGAMCVSVTDNPGPIHHRRNGMLICTVMIFIVSLITGLVAPYSVLTGLMIFVFCFIFSMMGVYGNRAISIGVAALLVMVLNIGHHYAGREVIINSLYIFTGGVWYMSLSLLLYSIRPYKLAQQALGDLIIATGEYLGTRASFYDKEINYENSYRQILQLQVAVHEKRNLVRELLFKSHGMVKEPTNTGRVLLMIFIDVNDLIERTMTSYDYESLHKNFDDTGILYKYRQLILALSKELDDIGIAVKSGSPSSENNGLSILVKETKEYLNDFVDKNRTADNVATFLSLRNILNNIEDIAARIHTLHLYTTYDKALTKAFPSKIEYNKFAVHTDINGGVIIDNLNLKSNIFRHALRVSIATLVGYSISNFFPFGHSYWILLTIIVILKPAYSLTKKRNYQRVTGTVAGALTGLLILFLIHDNNLLLAVMLLLMVATYSFLRTNYMVSVFFMTPYILLLFHLLNNGNPGTIFFDRLIDTAIGSSIAFIANFFLMPAWEKEQIKNYMAEAIKENVNYFRNVSATFTGRQVSLTEYKLSRRNSFISLANLSDALTRMLSEPASKQKDSKLIQQFVVLNHMLTSHTATLSYYVKHLAGKYNSDDFVRIIKSIDCRLTNAKALLTGAQAGTEKENTDDFSSIDNRVNELIEKRTDELKKGMIETETRKTLSELKSIADQLRFIYNISYDIEKISEQLVADREA